MKYKLIAKPNSAILTNQASKVGELPPEKQGALTEVTEDGLESNQEDSEVDLEKEEAGMNQPASPTSNKELTKKILKFLANKTPA